MLVRYFFLLVNPFKSLVAWIRCQGSGCVAASEGFQKSLNSAPGPHNAERGAHKACGLRC